MSSQNSAFEGLTKEEIKAIADAANQELNRNQSTNPGSGGGDPTPPKVSVVLPNGEQFTGTTQELQTRMGELYQAQEEEFKTQYQQNHPQTAQNPAQTGGFVPPQWDQNTQKAVVERMSQNFHEGMREYNKRVYGLEDPVVALTAIIQKMQQDMTGINNQLISSRYEEFKVPENKKVVEGIMQQYRIPNSAEGYEQAYWMAKGQGKFKVPTTETKPPETTTPPPQKPGDTNFQGTPHNPNPNYANNLPPGVDPSIMNWNNPYSQGFVPPQVGRGSPTPVEASPEALEWATQNMSRDELRELANRVGQMKPNSGNVQ